MYILQFLIWTIIRFNYRLLISIINLINILFHLVAFLVDEIIKFKENKCWNLWLSEYNWIMLELTIHLKPNLIFICSLLNIGSHIGSQFRYSDYWISFVEQIFIYFHWMMKIHNELPFFSYQKCYERCKLTDSISQYFPVFLDSQTYL